MGIKTHDSVRICPSDAVTNRTEDATCQILDIDLVNNARGRRNHTKVVKRLLPPAEKLVPFAVTSILSLSILLERIRRPEEIDHH